MFCTAAICQSATRWGRSHCASFAFYCLTNRQGNARAGLGQIFTQNQNGVVLFDFTQGWRGERRCCAER
ncbi:Uncharacterised protein [Ewingella americana]|uniref:Uncharacterized protein n=1 Tax=Ewingella americana TaxID=41202 RepID=A0A377NA02_9GAMM|nr:Uncharacterised protein [Ewingella americana]